MIHQRLREERKRLKLTQAALAEMTGLTRKTQSLYDRGERNPNTLYLQILAERGADIHYILTGQSSTTHHPGEMPMNAPNTTNPSFPPFYAQHLTVNGEVTWAMPAENGVPVPALLHAVDDALRHHNGRVFVAVAMLPPDEYADEALPAPDPDDSTVTAGEAA